LQRVAEPKTGKNRMHLDLRVPALEPELARLAALGATVLTPEPIDEDVVHWVVMADPDGNEFCVRCQPGDLHEAAHPSTTLQRCHW
jgi:predicted enzyme related to lactoylglutathione lyase